MFKNNENYHFFMDVLPILIPYVYDDSDSNYIFWQNFVLNN